jgi:hypothetical protein
MDLILTNGAAATGSTGEEIQSPEATIDVTATGRIASATVSRQPLRKSAVGISVALGSDKSLNRYGPRRMVLENDYIYSSMSQFGIAKSIVARFGDLKARLPAAKSLALWDLELFDRIRVRDAELGIDSDFVVVGFSHGFRSQQTTFEAVEL